MVVPADVSFRSFAGGVGVAVALPVLVLLPLVSRPGAPAAPQRLRAPGSTVTLAPRSASPHLLQPSRSPAPTLRRSTFRPLATPGGAGGSPGPISLALASPSAADPALGDWVWAGTVSIGAETYAILQNTTSKVGTYLKAGDVFGSGQVVSVSPTRLLFRSGSGVSSLALASGETAVAPPTGAAPGSSVSTAPTPPAGPPSGPPSGPPRPAPIPPPTPLPVAAPARTEVFRRAEVACRMGSRSGAFGMLVRVPESAVSLSLVTARGYNYRTRAYRTEDARSMVHRRMPFLALSAVHYDIRSGALISPAFSQKQVLMRNPTYGTVVTWGSEGLRFHDRGEALPGGVKVAFAGVGPRILRDGQVPGSLRAEGMPRVPRYPTRRVLLGKDREGRVCFGVVRAGVTIEQAAAVAGRRGLVDAVLLDGGRSATFYLRRVGFVARHTSDRPSTNLLMAWLSDPRARPRVEVLSWKESKLSAA